MVLFVSLPLWYVSGVALWSALVDPRPPVTRRGLIGASTLGFLCSTVLAAVTLDMPL